MTKSAQQYAALTARRERVKVLREQGFTMMQIAVKLGVCKLTIVKDCAVLSGDFRPCRHCGAGVICRPRDLCWRCFENLKIRALYPSGQEDYEGDGEDGPLLPRQPGEGHHRCLWCLQWKCEMPLKTCQGCTAAYNRLAVGMPEEWVPEPDFYEDQIKEAM